MKYNPFARTTSRLTQDPDVEVDNEIHRVHSEADATPENEMRRRRASLPVIRRNSDILLDRNDTNDGPEADACAAILDPELTKRARFRGLFRKNNDIDAEVTSVEDETLTFEERKRRSLKRKIPISQQLRVIFFSNWVSLALFPCIPAGFAVYHLHTNAVAVFCINFAAIIPSATLLSTSLNDLSIRAGEKSVILPKSRQISVLKLSLLGIILWNLLLTTGLSFLLGGLNRLEQYFSVSLAQMISMLLLLAVMSLIIPSAAHLLTDTTAEGILAQSRGISVVILVSYALWLRFTLFTHRVLFDEPTRKAPRLLSAKRKEGEAMRGIASIGAGTAAAAGGGVNAKSLFKNSDEDMEDDEEFFETCELSLTGALITLIVSVVLIAFNTQFATDSIQSILQRRKTCLMLVPLTVLLAWCMGVNEMDVEFDGFSIATLFASIIIVTYVVQEGKSNW
ncbi:hypothetical protein EK21DRAFT_104520 [Setomelanomma holmii]|uniref:Sodium/calcium exchanger membrane region domain-containing protein n=1 Tax=Setomelanomma holmii TaxID=210430 RepID=A0A9P4GZ84_9PLEO|nr:hypothetical protein EK21DRAFT_104520 [Setomelanomma holmii]